ncbi:putative B-block binding subunit of TFIIIC [Lyophyllum shimeji]|uniref:B-block binding subunit of TFIIIC n=1 Tax=Lyophyllum shimeji TaxID=47721 RepID=A0A9P3UKK6_LYOSH|nr:putative B-block binding subunit of TFIIIC [Lyophyllum shimeji]
MDELLHHCLRELSFDGDLGCNVSRLRDFITEFYAHTCTPQNTDDAFCAFVWSLVVQQPTVRVGTVPPGVTSEVWIAPQTSAKRKARAKGEEHVETTPTELDVVPDARNRTLDDLRSEYGDNLRIAVQPDAIYAAITGSHIRFAKLSPMVYSALQIITRGRDGGVTVVELGQQSGYDQKTCFYLVRQLTELDLVVKVRRGGVGTHFVIHKHFFDRNPSWQAIRDEEIRAESSQDVAPATAAEVPQEEDKSAVIQSLDFSPIDARHLSSLPLIRGRVVKLLKASRNQMHASNNMLITLGFSNPTKTDRRFFQSRIREMIQQGIIEKVVVRSNKKKSVNASVRCFRLVSKERGDDESIVVQPSDGDDDERDVGEQSAVKMNITIHKQIFDLLEESGMVGMTLNELSAALCQFDKRTIELLLTRAEKFPPPAHLSDLGIAGLMETSGRERRHRYFTVASYRQLVAKENLDNHSAYSEVDFSNVGGFLPVEANLFYENEDALVQYQDAFKAVEKASAKKRTFKNPILPDGSVKQGRPRKYPVGEDPRSLRKQATKRKRESIASKAVAHEDEEQSAKRMRVEEDEETAAPPPAKSAIVPKKRGRPPKAKQKEEDREKAPPTLPKNSGSDPKTAGDSNNQNDATSATTRRRSARRQPDTMEEASTAPKKRGRRKRAAGGVEATSDNEGAPPSSKRPHLAPETIDAPVSLLPDSDSQPAMGVDNHDEDGSKDIVAEPAPDEREPIPSPERILDQSMTTTQTLPAQAHLSPTPRPFPAVPDNVLYKFDSTTKQCPDAGSNTVPIDPALMMDVLEHTDKILNGPSTRISGSPLTPLNEFQTPESQSLVATPQSSHETDLQKPLPASNKTEMAAKSASKPRVNVSHLRRENELYRVVENMGGIVNIQTKDIFEEHIALLERMAKAGEPTSAPVGTRTDKRTAVATFDSLERRGRIKQLKTSVMTHTGVRRPASIVYLPSVSQEKLNAFLADLSRGVQSAPHPGNFVKIDEHVEYGADPTTVARGALPLQLLQMEEPGEDRKERWSKNIARAKQLFSYDDSVIRDVLLTERTTLAQLYGFIVGKAVRSRELHLSTLDAFEKGNPSPNIVSHQKRIVDLSFFAHDIPLGLYCSLVSSLSHDDELTRFIGTPEGRQTLVHDLPPNIYNILQIGRSRGRSRFLDILETLRALKLVTPLQPSTSDTPWITCAASGTRPSAFDVASSDGWTVSTPMAAPTYWHFNDIAPIHLWAASEVSPPFWQDVPVGSTADGVTFWRLLEEASTNAGIATSPDAVSVTGPSIPAISIARSLRRHVSWNSEYILTWHQMQYLRQFVDVTTGKTPLQEEDEGAAQIERISWVISAPRATVKNFFQTTHLKVLKDLDRLRKKSTQQNVEKKAKRAAATRASLAKKAADARLQREEEWDAMLQRLHPTPLDTAAAVRIRRIRNRFLQTGSANGLSKWEAEVIEALREAEMVATKVLNGNKRAFAARAAPVPMDTAPLTDAVNPPEKPVEALIALQGPPLVPRQDKVKRRRKGKNVEEEPVEPKPKTLRRHRFQWNRDYEELARDASAIIRARCRNLPRLDWAAFEQVFPAVPRNTVRQRLAHIRETPGNEAYLNRLEDRWYEIWIQYRGTPLLPDDDPTSASNFNLIKHIEFLRQHVDKNALRVGFAQPKEKPGTTLPASVDALLNECEVVENMPIAPSWDFVWNAVVEEGREKRMLRQPFLRTPEDMPYVGEHPFEAISLAESAMKMTLGTPHERYDPEPASTLLRNIGEQYVSVATKNLLSRGVLSKLVRDPQKQKPGRQLKISEVNQNAIGGSIPRDTYQDAIALEELSLQDDTWREWPLLATDGDSAALIQLVSENRVEFKVDTTHAQSARPILDWNSKKADDDQIETAVYVRTVAPTIATPQPPIQSLEPSPVLAPVDLPAGGLNPAHGIAVDGSIASCRRLTNTGLADCMVCLEDEWVSFNDSITQEERELAMHVLTLVRQGAEHGVTKSHLRANANATVTNRQLFSIVKRMTESPVPMLFWAGYSSLVLVSSAYIKNWTVLVSENPATRIFPRRWFDISGVKITEYWDAALKAVMGVIVFRPGVSQAELRWRLRSVYDRQEVGDILRSLQEDGFLKMRCDPTIVWDDEVNVAALDDREEKGVFWFHAREAFSLFRLRLVLCLEVVAKMRVKQLWDYVPLPVTFKLVWDRITFSRLTTAYFIFSFIHFIIQLSFQIKAFTINADAARFLNDIVVQGNATSKSLPILRGNALHMCSWVPDNLNLDGDRCDVVWNGTKGTNVVGSPSDNQSPPSNDRAAAAYSSVTVNTSVTVITSTSSTASPSSIPSTSIPSSSLIPSSSVNSSSSVSSSTSAEQTTVTPLRRPQTVTVFVSPTRPTSGVFAPHDDDDNNDGIEDRSMSKREMPRVLAFQEGGQTKVNISGMGFDNTPATLDTSCIWALNWPVSVLDNTKREDLVFIAFQFWVLGMSIVALLNESIPHIFASLVTHMMATAWAAFQVTHTANFRSDFDRVITRGACNGTSLLPHYWHDRGTAEFTSLAFNVLAFLISSFLTWKLFKLFGWQTFKRVGASRSINRIYKIVLMLSITIQLSLFFMVVTVSLWLDQLFSSTIGDLVDFLTLYKVTSFVTLVLLVPWLMTGWFAVRRELRVPMFIFLLLSVLYLAGWGVMFFSTTFRWTFITWRFFSLMASASVLLTVASLTLGVIGRYNFGKGLLRYLNAQEALPGDDFEYYSSSDMEKVDFPSNEKPIPTYSATFGSGLDVPAPSQMFISRGPRFFDRFARPFETAKTSPVTPPPNAYTVVRKASNGSSHSGGSVQRSDTRSSENSFGSLASYYSYGDRGHSRTDSQPKRWVIE